MARAVMLQGTGSDVGKTVLVAGLCRAARRRGMRVRPFKPQNMSNNTAVADLPGEPGGGEIGRAQWLQALACGVAPSVHMNPVLLKPQSETGSQIIVQGRLFGQARARDYQALKPKLMVADEPTSALDVSVQAKVLELFQNLQRELGFACLFVTHDLAVVDVLADHICVMRSGRIVEQGTRDQILRNPQEEYTQRLIAAVPLPDPDKQRERRELRAKLMSSAGDVL